MVWLMCKCGRKWNYMGTQKIYCTCPNCGSTISIHIARRRHIDDKKVLREERVRESRRMRRRR